MRTINIYLAAFVMTGCVAGVSSTLVLAVERPSPNAPYDAILGGTEKEAGVKETASPLTLQEEPAQPTEAGEVQERGFMQPPPGGQLQQQLQMVGPTPNLTAVADRLRLKSKSLTTVITVPANLPLTQPVTINIWYSSPAGSDTPSRGEPYNPSTGNRFVHHDPEGNGKPRQLRMDISLLEPNPAGGFHRFSFSRQVNLDPLYDVTISPMRFGLLTPCDTLGQHSEIALHWYTPEKMHLSRRFNADITQFQGTGSVWVTIDEFAWAGAEVSASQKLHRTIYFFKDRDFYGVQALTTFAECIAGRGCGFYGGTPGDLDLVPGKTTDSAQLAANLRQVTFSHRQSAENATGQQCQAHLQHTIKYLLRQYPNL